MLLLRETNARNGAVDTTIGTVIRLVDTSTGTEVIQHAKAGREAHLDFTSICGARPGHVVAAKPRKHGGGSFHNSVGHCTVEIQTSSKNLF